jgi:hypothetical protein
VVVIDVKVGDRVVTQERDGWTRITTLRFRVVAKVTAARITTDDGAVWDRSDGIRIPRRDGGSIRVEEEGDVERDATARRRLRVRDALFEVERGKDGLTDEEIATLEPVLASIVDRMKGAKA